jgi:hypothetical protein
MRNKIEGIDDKYLDAINDPEEYDRLYKLARERATEIYVNWMRQSGQVLEQSRVDFEIQRCIEDAVHCGIQRALGIQVPLKSEEPD